MNIRLLSLALLAAAALTGCVTYGDYGYGPGYYRTESSVVYRRYGGYPYGYYDDYYYGGYGAPYGYRYGYGYPYYGRHHYYYRPPYREHDHGHRPPNGGGSSGKPPWRDLNRLRPAEGQHPMTPPPRASRPASAAPVYRPTAPSAPAYRPAPATRPAMMPAYRPSTGSNSSERRSEARRIRAEMKTKDR